MHHNLSDAICTLYLVYFKKDRIQYNRKTAAADGTRIAEVKFWAQYALVPSFSHLSNNNPSKQPGETVHNQVEKEPRADVIENK